MVVTNGMLQALFRSKPDGVCTLNNSHDGSMGLVYLPTFAINLSQMWANIPYVDPMGLEKPPRITKGLATCQFFSLDFLM